MKQPWIFCLFFALGACLAWGGDKPLTVQDIMKFRSIQDAQIAEDGTWIAFTSRPDRGRRAA